LSRRPAAELAYCDHPVVAMMGVKTGGRMGAGLRAETLVLGKRRRAEYRLPPHSKFLGQKTTPDISPEALKP